MKSLLALSSTQSRLTISAVTNIGSLDQSGRDRTVRARCESAPASQPGQRFPLIRKWHGNQDTQDRDPGSCPTLGAGPVLSDEFRNATQREQWARVQGKWHILGPEFVVGVGWKNSPKASATWTKATSDGDFVEHLIASYFCWEYPIFASLSIFLKTFGRDHGLSLLYLFDLRCLRFIQSTYQSSAATKCLTNPCQRK